MPSELIIFPCNGNGIEAMDCIDPALYDFVGFVEDIFGFKQATAGKWMVANPSLYRMHTEDFVLAFPGCSASFQTRKEYIDRMEIDESRVLSVVHHTVFFDLNELKRKNYLVMASVVISSIAWIVEHIGILSNTMIRQGAEVRMCSQFGSKVKIADGTNVCNSGYIGRGRRLINIISK